MPSNKKLLQAAAGSAGGDNLYVEDVFSTYLVTGTNAAVTVNNGLDLDGEGGMVWVKKRSAAGSHNLYDTERGANNRISSNNTNAQDTKPLDFTSTGFSDFYWDSGVDYTSWSFRKAEKFFDVVTWTGNATAGREIPHSLDSTPAFIITKRTDGADNWKCYHVGNPSPAEDHVIELDNTNAAGNESIWNDTAPTSTNFTVSAGGAINASGATYVAYLFASDAGGFGDDGSENIIKCGSFTTDGNATPQDINLGFEPQFFMYKRTDAASNWFMADTMRGWTAQNTSGESAETYLYANLNVAEAAPNTWGSSPNATGINWRATGLTSNSNYIYIAIRRPMKTPESGTEVFAMDTLGSTGDGNQPGYRSPFPVDMGLKTSLTGNQRQISTRLLQGTELLTESTAAEAASASKQFDYMNGTDTSTATSSVNMMWMFKRATGFMDAVAYIGANSNGNQSLAVNHNLGVVPEFIICKNRGRAAGGWISYHKDLNGGVNPQDYYIYLERTTAAGGPDGVAWGTSGGGGVAPTSTNFTVGGYYDNGYAGDTYISYLFATVAGVSKVGSYTGNAGYAVNVDCGFSAGARFILIRRTDSTGDWYVYDSLRGIVAGNDPYFFLNNTAAQVTNTDYIDPLASGFTVTSSAPAGLNASGGTYIFLAIA